MNTTREPLLTPKELAYELRRDISYVRAMVRLGFPMPGDRCTLTEAREWLALNPKPRRKSAA